MNEQIMEMALDICKSRGVACVDDCEKCRMHEDCLYQEIAKGAYNAGYRKQSEWISVEDRLPDKGQEVLAYRGDYNGDMMNTYTYLGRKNWEDDYGYRGSTEHEGITHWMPLPVPPKGE